MIIDAKKLNGLCSCGKVHEMFTEFAIVESGCLKQLDSYREKYALNGFATAIYDENTYLATADRHVNAEKEIILPQKSLTCKRGKVGGFAHKSGKTAHLRSNF